MISVIIPVYNVFAYIDQCLTTVVNQSFCDIEILLINDGSTDGSDKKCEEWAEKDSRIRYFSRKNEGLGPTRNFGVDRSLGQYIMFIDSDDWVDHSIVEKLYHKMMESGADIAICDRYDVSAKTGKKEIRTNEMPADIITVEQHPESVFDISTTAWAKLIKKELLVLNNIRQPAHRFEDLITRVILAYANKIAYVCEPLYYYLIEREGSIINDVKSVSEMRLYMDTLIQEFKVRGLYDTYAEYILRTCIQRTHWNLMWMKNVYEADMVNQKKKSYAYIKEKFGVDIYHDILLFDCLCAFGSYNLMTCAKMVMGSSSPDSMREHYCFSSIISAMSDYSDTMSSIPVVHNNSFRKEHILKDIKKEFSHKNIGEFTDIHYILIDFLEERFPIGIYKGCYFTYSDAFAELGLEKEYEFEILDRFHEETQRLWEESCKKFISRLRRYKPDYEIVLVKMKLAEYYGVSGKEFPYENIEEIHKMNTLLERYYEYFIAHCPGVLIVDVESDMYFTDMHFRHGVYPWHLNHQMYREIRQSIMNACKNHFERIVIFGAGEEGAKAIHTIGEHKVSYIVDNDPLKWNKTFFFGKKIKSFQYLKDQIHLHNFKIVIAANEDNTRDMAKQLTDNGIFNYMLYDEILENASFESRPETVRFKNLYQGKRVFIIGAGPSLRLEDLEKLKMHQEICFASNKVYKAFDKTTWRPQLYCVLDNKILAYYHREILAQNMDHLFVSDSSVTQYKMQVPTELFRSDNVYTVNLVSRNFGPKSLPMFSSDPSKVLYEGYTVTYGILQLAAYMGFQEIYLLGIDFEYLDPSGQDCIAKDHFLDSYVEDKEIHTNPPRLEKCLLAYKRAEQYSRENGFRIYNATRGGKLEVFERVDFDSLF